MGLVKHKKLSKTEYSGLSEKDEDTFYAVNENGDFSEINMDNSAELYIGDKKISGIEYDLATETADGLMSADDKKKTNAITVDATKKSVAIGYDNTNTSNASFVIGNSNSVTHNNSVALGQGLKSGAQNQTILGKFNASSTDIFTVGYGTSDTNRKNIFSVSPYGGINNNIKNFRVFTDNSVGEYSIALGRLSSATGSYATAMGYSAKANGMRSVAISSNATANGDYSTVLNYNGTTGILTGDDTYKYGKLSVKSTLAFTYNSNAVYGVSVPKQTPITFIYNGIEYTIENNNTYNSSLFLVQDTNNTLFKADLSPKHVSASSDNTNVGNMRVLSSTHLQNGVYALLVNQQDNGVYTYNEKSYLFLWEKSSSSSNKANGAVNLGYTCYCAGNFSSCFGEQTAVSGIGSVSFGRMGMVAGDYCFSSGFYNSASGSSSFVVGANNINTGSYAFVVGSKNKSLHNSASLIGMGLRSHSAYQIILGKYNAVDDNSILIIGDGESETNRSNIFTVSKTGMVTAPTFKGALQGNADTATKVNNSLTIIDSVGTRTYNGSETQTIDITALQDIGDIADLETSSKTDLVSAINEVNQKAMAGEGTVTDSTISPFAGYLPSGTTVIDSSTTSTNGDVLYDMANNRFVFRDKSETIMKYYANWTNAYLYNDNYGTSNAIARKGKIFSYADKHWIATDNVLIDVSFVVEQSKQYTDYEIVQCKQWTNAQITNRLNDKIQLVTELPANPEDGVLYLIPD